MKHLIAIVFALFAFVAVGQVQAMQQHGSPCARDAQKYCKGANPVGGSVQACLQKNQDLVSVTCRKNLQNNSQISLGGNPNPSK